MVRWCFGFLNGEVKESLDHDVRTSGPKVNSLQVSDVSTETPTGSQHPSLSQSPSNLRIFTFSELKNATRNFSRSLIVGEGGFGCVYRGSIRIPEEPHGRIEIAVKQYNRKGMQGHKEWLTEVNVLGVVEHPNLVKLIGYCIEDDERGIQLLLVYEYMPNRSVEDHLSSRSTRTLSWAMRLKIALDAARGLTYLHEGMDFQVVGTLGYAAPEYMQTGHLTAKSDIWSYGVVLYELITGRCPIDRNRPKGEQKLLEWVKPYISDVKKFRIILDPRLDGYYSLKSATKLATIANKCLLRLPKSRPNMSEVLGMVQKLVESVDIGALQPPLISASEEAASREGCKKGGELKFKIRQMKMGLGWTLKLA